jgi:hypothetical protein
MPALLTILVFAVLAGWCFWLAIEALRSGVATTYARYARSRHFRRRANPTGFWLVVGVYLGLGLFSAAVTIARLFFG